MDEDETTDILVYWDCHRRSCPTLKLTMPIEIEATVTELDVAAALLQLRDGPSDCPAIDSVSRISPHIKMEIESAATLFMSCFTMPSTSAALQSQVTNDSPRYSISSQDDITEVNSQSLHDSPMSCNRKNKMSKKFRNVEPKRTPQRNPFNAQITETSVSARDTELSGDEWRPEEHKLSKQSFQETPHSRRTDLVPIGEGHAMVPRRLLKQIDWSSYTGATRKLLTAVFSRRVLATHSLTGRPSPAFPGKPAKKRLEPELVNDIVQIVVERCNVPESIVRTSITTKCADESKMYRSRQQNKKKSESQKRNQENIPPSPSDE